VTHMKIKTIICTLVAAVMLSGPAMQAAAAELPQVTVEESAIEELVESYCRMQLEDGIILTEEEKAIVRMLVEQQAAAAMDELMAELQSAIVMEELLAEQRAIAAVLKQEQELAAKQQTLSATETFAARQELLDAYALAEAQFLAEQQAYAEALAAKQVPVEAEVPAAEISAEIEAPVTRQVVETPMLPNISAYTGMDVVNYAVQFVGNPYVYGGSSLTRGTDCSGFVMSVYKNFGVSLPHSSRADRNVGMDVGGLANAQPGDIVCYSGHVGIYIGDGKIVHASTERTGIIISDVNYRKPITIRRIF